MKTQNKSITRTTLKEYFIKALDEPMLFWNRGWKILPMVNTKGKPYSGINKIVLSLVASNKGYKDYRWVTYNNCKDLSLDGKSAYVRKGEKATYIEYWYCQLLKPKDMKQEVYNNLIDTYNRYLKKSSNSTKAYKNNCFSYEEYDLLKKQFKDIDELNKVTRVKNIPVYNGDQIENIIPLEKVDFKGMEVEEQILDICTNYMKNERITYEESVLGEAYYNFIEDKIHLPIKNSFDSTEDYIATLVHEIAHSTGHENRLHRWDDKGFDSKGKYALEELNAELAAALLCSEYNISMTKDTLNKHLENHKAYIQYWYQFVGNDYDKGEILEGCFLIAEGINSYIKKRANNNIVNENTYKIDFLNKKSIIECDDKDKMSHIKENTDILNKLHCYENEKCNIKINYYDEYGMYIKGSKMSCSLSIALNELPRNFDLRNGTDFLLEGESLVVNCYGKSIDFAGKNSYKKTKMIINLDNKNIDLKKLLSLKKLRNKKINKKM